MLTQSSFLVSSCSQRFAGSSGRSSCARKASHRAGNAEPWHLHMVHPFHHSRKPCKACGSASGSPELVAILLIIEPPLYINSYQGVRFSRNSDRMYDPCTYDA